jgi:hypothetical protein
MDLHRVQKEIAQIHADKESRITVSAVLDDMSTLSVGDDDT